MRNWKRGLALILALVLTVGLLPTFTAPAQAATTQETNDFYRILQLDAGRKYFTKDWIIALLYEMDAAGYNQLQLAFGNKGLRFLLDDMAVGTYTDAQVTAAVKAGNEAFYDAGDVNELTQAEMDEILAKAEQLGIEVVPVMNTPFHSEAIITAMEELEVSGSVYYGDNQAALNLDNSAVKEFVSSLMQKYIHYFAAKGCKYFCFGADEYPGGWDTTFYSYANSIAKQVTDAGMTPRVFNDSFRDGSSTYISSDPKAEVCYWYTGYSGNMYAGASTVEKAGYPLINTNKDYYYVMSKTQITEWNSTVIQYQFSGEYNESSWISHASTFSNTKYNCYNGGTGNYSYTEMPAGSMFCVWADNPGAWTETEVAQQIRMILRVIGARMQDSNSYAGSDVIVEGGFNADGTLTQPPVELEPIVGTTYEAEAGGFQFSVTAADSDLGVSVQDMTEAKEADFQVPGFRVYKVFDITLTSGTQNYEGEGDVTIEGLDNGVYTVYDEDFQEISTHQVLDGTLTFRAPHFSVYYIAEEDGDYQVIDMEVGDTYHFTVANGDSEFTAAPDGTIVNATISSTDVPSDPPQISVSVTDSLGVWGVNYPENMLDGDTKSIYWSSKSQANSGNIVFELSESRIITGLKLTSMDGDVLAGADIQVSEDGTTWETVGSITGQASTSVTQNIAPKLAKYVRLHLNSYSTNWLKIAEVEILCADTGTQVTLEALVPGVTEAEIGGVRYQINVAKKVGELTVYRSSVTSWSVVAMLPNEIQALGTQYSFRLLSGDANFNLNDRGYVSTAQDSLAQGHVEVTVKNDDGVELAVYNLDIHLVNEALDQAPGLWVNLVCTNSLVYPDGWTAVDANPNINTGTYMIGEGTGVYTQIPAYLAYSEEGLDLSNIPESSAPAHGESLDGTYTFNARFWRTMYHTAEDRQNMEGWTNTSALGTTITRLRYWQDPETGLNTWAYKQGDQWISIDASQISATDKSQNQVALWFKEMTEITDEVTTLTSDWGPISISNGQAVMNFAVRYEDGGITEAETGIGFNIPGTDKPQFNNDGMRIVHGIGAKPDPTTGYEVFMITLTPSWTSDYTGNYGGSGDPHDVTYNSDNEVVAWVLEEELLPDNMTPIQAGSVLINENNKSEAEQLGMQIGGEPTIDEICVAMSQGVLVTFYVRAIEVEQNTILNVVWWDDEANTAISLNPMTISVAGQNKTFATELKGNAAAVVLGETLVLDDSAYVTNAAGNPQTIDKDLLHLVVSNGKYKSGAYEYKGAEISADGLTLTLHYDLKAGLTYDPMYVLDFGLPIEFPISDTLGTYGSIVSVTINNNGSFGTLTYNAEKETFTYIPSKVLTSTDIVSIEIEYMAENATTRVDTVPKTLAFAPATTVYYESNNRYFKQDGSWTLNENGANRQQQDSAYRDYELVDPSDYNYGLDGVYATGGYDTLSTSTKYAISEFTFSGTGFELYLDTNSADAVTYVWLYDHEGTLVKLYAVNTSMLTGSNTALITGTAYSVPVVSVDDLDHTTYTVKVQNVRGTTTVAGFRVYNTLVVGNPSNLFTAYTSALEEYPSYYELRDYVVGAVVENMEGESDYVTRDDSGNLVSSSTQVMGTMDGTLAYVSPVDGAFTGEQILDLVDNGPKNELYLQPGMSVSFKLSAAAAARNVQLGMRSLTGENISYTMNEETATLSSKVDMFYDVVYNYTGEYTVTITNNGTSGILAITKLKICDAPAGTSALAAFCAEDFQDEFQPETFRLSNTAVSLVAGRKTVVTVQTSTDVESLLVGDQVITRYYDLPMLRIVDGKLRLDYLRIFTVTLSGDQPGTYTYNVVACDAEGNQGQPQQLTLTVKKPSGLISWLFR